MKIGEDNYIQQLQSHNEKALLYVIDAYGGLLMAVIRKHLFCLPDKQEECFDDVLLNIWQHISSFDGQKSTFQNWAAAVARYRAIDYLRQYQREQKTARIEEAGACLIGNLRRDGFENGMEESILDRLEENALSDPMEQMLSCLKPADRELFLKLYAEEKDIGQVSRETGMKKEVIYNRLSRGKKKIRRQFIRERGV